MCIDYKKLGASFLLCLTKDLPICAFSVSESVEIDDADKIA